MWEGVRALSGASHSDEGDGGSEDDVAVGNFQTNGWQRGYHQECGRFGAGV